MTGFAAAWNYADFVAGNFGTEGRTGKRNAGAFKRHLCLCLILQCLVQEAAELHDNDAKLREEVETAANKKEVELQKEDDELEQASNSEDKMAAEIMGPKASAAEREEEKILTGEVPTNINMDTKEAEQEELDFGAPAKVKALIAKVENDD